MNHRNHQIFASSALGMLSVTMLLLVPSLPAAAAQARNVRNSGDHFQGMSSLEISVESDKEVLKGALFKNSFVATVNTKVGWTERVRSVATNGFTSEVTITEYNSGLVGIKNKTSLVGMNSDIVSGTWAFLQGLLGAARNTMTNAASAAPVPVLVGGAVMLDRIEKGVAASRQLLATISTNTQFSMKGSDLREFLGNLPPSFGGPIAKALGSVTGFMTQEGDLVRTRFSVTVDGSNIQILSLDLPTGDPRISAGSNLLANIFGPYLLGNLARSGDHEIIQEFSTIPAGLFKLALAPLITMNEVTPDLKVKVTKLASDPSNDFTQESTHYRIEQPILTTTFTLEGFDTPYRAYVDANRRQQAMTWKAKGNLRLLDDPRIPSVYLYHAKIDIFDAQLNSTQLVTGLLTNLISSKKPARGNIEIVQKRVSQK